MLTVQNYGGGKRREPGKHTSSQPLGIPSALPRQRACGVLMPERQSVGGKKGDWDRPKVTEVTAKAARPLGLPHSHCLLICLTVSRDLPVLAQTILYRLMQVEVENQTRSPGAAARSGAQNVLWPTRAGVRARRTPGPLSKPFRSPGLCPALPPPPSQPLLESVQALPHAGCHHIR